MVEAPLGRKTWRGMVVLESAEGQEQASNLLNALLQCFKKFGEKSRLQAASPGVSPRILLAWKLCLGKMLAPFIRQLHISYSIATYFRQDKFNMRPVSNHPPLPGYHAFTSIAPDADVRSEFHKYQRTPVILCCTERVADDCCWCVHRYVVERTKS